MYDTPIIYTSSFTGAVDNEMLSFTGPEIERGSVDIPIYKACPNWKKIIAQFKLTDATYPLAGQTSATNGVIFTGVTSAFFDEALTASSTAAVKQDGSTAFTSGNITTDPATGAVVITWDRDDDSASNIAAVLGFFTNVTSMSTVTGSAKVIIS